MSANNGSGPGGPLGNHVKPADDWKLRRAAGRESPWLLSSPFWRGEIELTTKDLSPPKRIREAAIDQKRVYLPPSFDVDWLKERTTIAGGEKPRLVREPCLFERLITSQQGDEAA